MDIFIVLEFMAVNNTNYAKKQKIKEDTEREPELSEVQCNKEYIYVEISFPESDFEFNTQTLYYLENARNGLWKNCQPLYHAKGINFKIYLKEFSKCGFTRIVNKLKSHVIFYQNLIMEQNNTITSTIPVKCSYKIGKYPHKEQHKIVKRDALPDGFEEDDDVEILETIQQEAPEPEVRMEVRQNDILIDGMVTVIPGTPLVMEIKLNDVASSIYGLNVNYLEVSDSRDMSETIIFRGCTADPYLFGNFNLSESNSLKAKFRAFKFPNTAFVQFRANVQICLKKCSAPQCITTTSRRRRREIKSRNNHTYEVSLNLLLNIDVTSKVNEEQLLKLQSHLKQLMITNLNTRKFL